MPRYSRRSALRLAGLTAVSAVAGCLSDGSESSPTARTGGTPASTGTQDSGPTAGSQANDSLAMGGAVTSEDGRSVTVSRPRVQSIIVTPDEGSSAHSRPAGRAESQFLTADVSTDDAIDALALDAVLDGEPQGSSEFRHSFRPGGSGSVSLAVPVTEVQQGSVQWRPGTGERYRWTLPPSVVSTIGAAPAFTAVTLDVPETLARGDPFTATVTVSNDGDREGVFRAMVLDQGASSLPLAGPFTVTVGAGETVTHDISGTPMPTAQSERTAVLDWGLGERRATVTVE